MVADASPANSHTAGNTAAPVGLISVQLLLDRGLPPDQDGLNGKAENTENGADASATLERDVIHPRRIALQKYSPEKER